MASAGARKLPSSRRTTTAGGGPRITAPSAYRAGSEKPASGRRPYAGPTAPHDAASAPAHGHPWRRPGASSVDPQTGSETREDHDLQAAVRALRSLAARKHR